MHHRKRTDQRYRDRHQRNDRRPPGLQEQDDHQHHEDQGFEQRVHDRFDGAADKDRRVIGDAVIHARREILFQLGHLAAHIVGDVDGVGTGALENRNRNGGLVIDQRAQRILAGPQLDPGDVLEACDFTVVAGANHNVLELFLGDQAALGIHRQLEAGVRRCRLGTQGTGGHLTVLLADRVDHIGGGQVARGSLVRIEPYAQGIVAHAEQLHVAHAVQARQFILDVEDRVVGQVEHVVTLIRGGQVHHHGQVGGGLVHGDTDARHFLGQLGLSARHTVLHLHLRVVQVGAQGEGDGQGQLAVGGRLGGHVQHVLDAGDCLLQRCGHGFTDDLGVGAGEVGAYYHGRRHHFRVFADGQLEQRDGTGDQDQQRQHCGEDRP